MEPKLSNVSVNLNSYIPHEPTISLLAIHQTERYIYVHQKVLIKMFITALLIIAQLWNLPKFSSITYRLYNINIMGYYREISDL